MTMNQYQLCQVLFRALEVDSRTVGLLSIMLLTPPPVRVLRMSSTVECTCSRNEDRQIDGTSALLQIPDIPSFMWTVGRSVGRSVGQSVMQVSRVECYH